MGCLSGERHLSGFSRSASSWRQATKSICNYCIKLLVKLFSFLLWATCFQFHLHNNWLSMEQKSSEIASHIVWGLIIKRHNWMRRWLWSSNYILLSLSMKVFLLFLETKCWRGHTSKFKSCRTTSCLSLWHKNWCLFSA